MPNTNYVFIITVFFWRSVYLALVLRPMRSWKSGRKPKMILSSKIGGQSNRIQPPKGR
jgi:hypothetical protein